MDDNGIAANDTKRLPDITRTVFECIRNAGLSFTMSKSHIGAKHIDFLGRTTTPHGVAPQADNGQKRLVKTENPQIQKSTSTVYRILELLP